LKKSLLKKFKNITNCRREGREGRGGVGWGGWRIVIPMPEAINFVDGRRQKYVFMHRAGWEEKAPFKR
jgi:hypothetical protein